MRGQKKSKLALAVGVTLRQLRENAGLTQEELGFRFGLHRTYISMLERGYRVPSLETLLALADYLGAKPVKLMEAVEKALKLKR